MLTTSLHVDVTFFFSNFSKKSFVISALYLLNSNVYNLPFYPSNYDIAQESDPLPVPAYTTVCPGRISNLNKIAELSIEYKICVFLAKWSVIKVDLG